MSQENSPFARYVRWCHENGVPQLYDRFEFAALWAQGFITERLDETQKENEP